MRRIQGELPAWVQKSGRQAEAMPLMQRLQGLVRSKSWQEADKVADDVLALMGVRSNEGANPATTATQAASHPRHDTGEAWSRTAR